MTRNEMIDSICDLIGSYGQACMMLGLAINDETKSKDDCDALLLDSNAACEKLMGFIDVVLPSHGIRSSETDAEMTLTRPRLARQQYLQVISDYCDSRFRYACNNFYSPRDVRKHERRLHRFFSMVLKEFKIVDDLNQTMTKLINELCKEIERLKAENEKQSGDRLLEESDGVRLH